MRGRLRLRLPLAIALAALVLTALLMWRADGAPPVRGAPAPEFPRHMQHDDWERARARRTVPSPVAVPASSPGAQPAETPAPARDPFLVALPAATDQPLIVLEANALRHSRLGELFIRCVLRRDGEDHLAEFARESGVDPLKDVDRVALSRDGLVVSGFFDRARFDRLEPDARVDRRGERGRIYRMGASEAPERRDGAGDGAVTVGVWGDQLVAFGTPEFVEQAFDRVEGRAPAPDAQFPEDLTYGEAYGVVPGSALEPLLRGAHGGIGERLAALASRIELHADAMNDVAVVAKVSGADAAALDDLASSIGAAMAVGRMQAKARGSTGLAELLEFARVERGGGEFSVELAVPADALERWFENCGDEGAPAPR